MHLKRVAIHSYDKSIIFQCTSFLIDHYDVETLPDIESVERFDLVILDSIILDENEQLFSIFQCQRPRFLIIGKSWPEENQIKALVNGAAGYCSISEPAELYLLALDHILKGDLWIQRHLVPKIIGKLIQLKSDTQVKQESRKNNASRERLNTLSNRELDVAKMIGSGESNKIIASTLNISERTVKAHLTSIFKKLDVPDRLHLALFFKEFS